MTNEKPTDSQTNTTDQQPVKKQFTHFTNIVLKSNNSASADGTYTTSLSPEFKKRLPVMGLEEKDTTESPKENLPNTFIFKGNSPGSADGTYAQPLTESLRRKIDASRQLETPTHSEEVNPVKPKSSI